jgi:hypothetical protein
LRPAARLLSSRRPGTGESLEQLHRMNEGRLLPPISRTLTFLMTRGRHSDVGRTVGPATGPRAARFQMGNDHLVVLSFPLPQPCLPESLSPAEREVAMGIIDGRTNAEIAAARGTSLRTVANQVATILHKASVGSSISFRTPGRSSEPREQTRTTRSWRSRCDRPRGRPGSSDYLA